MDAIVAGLLLGCFYAAVSMGLSVAFGLLDVPHIAHPAFVVLGAYGAFVLDQAYGLDPCSSGVAAHPAVLRRGVAVYRFYYAASSSAGDALRGLVFFFGVAVHRRGRP